MNLIQGDKWNAQTLGNTFPQDIVKDILKIQISQDDRAKTLIWSPSKSGIFSIKSVYLSSQDSRFYPPNPNITFNWKKLWSSCLHNRHKQLLWKIILNIIPCRGRLNWLFKVNDTSCFFCKHHTETVDHLFLHCPFIKNIWFKSFWSFNLTNFSNLSLIQWHSLIFEDKGSLFPLSDKKDEFIMFTAILFDNVWQSRNLKAHGKNSPSVQELELNVSRQANAHWKSRIETRQITASTLAKWSPPPDGWIKINVDAAYDDGVAFTGLVCRDKNGTILLASTKKFSCLDPLTAESLAILEACNLNQPFLDQKVIVESDCLEAITWLNGNATNRFWSSSPVLDKIKSFWSFWPKWRFKFISRNSNGAPHTLAKWAKSCNFVGIVPLHSIPVSVFCDIGHLFVVSQV
ncbi:hypothetical protein CASFOL_024519 [Castilleja foliolosa]|uniref:Reverse transcriptase zinc-binding domain-containing protein n=1 Tax=Castilleja foliolosa TaxID=1961234 RepID=A0ABD3CNK0_9LAMI